MHAGLSLSPGSRVNLSCIQKLNGNLVQNGDYLEGCYGYYPTVSKLHQVPHQCYFKSQFTMYTVQFLLTIVACDIYSARCLSHGKIVYNFHEKIACRYDCCRVLKHVSKACDIIRVVHDNRNQVVGFIYMKQLMS